MTYPSAQQATGQTTAYASWITRVGGYIIDGIPGGILAFIGNLLDGPKIDPNTLQVSGRGVVYYLFALAAFAFTVWNRWYQGGTTGQSIGRKAVGIRLVDAASGQPIGFGKAFARDICHIVDALPCLVGFLFPLWDAQKQTFADKIIKTVVVK